MRSALRYTSLAIVGVLCVQSAALACGDKLSVLGGGVRFDRIHLSRHPGSIVLFVNPESRLRAANDALRLGASLELAGHRVAVIENATDLERTLSHDAPDLVLLDVADAERLQQRLVGSAALPAMLPVAYGLNQTDLANTSAQVRCLAREPGRKGRRVLQAVEQLLAQRDKGLPNPCNSIARG